MTTDCPSTAMDCVRAVATSLLFASTCEEDITVPLTKLGYGFEYVPEPFLAIYRTPKNILFHQPYIHHSDLSHRLVHSGLFDRIVRQQAKVRGS